MTEDGTLTAVPIETIAQIAHEANRVLQQAQADPSIPTAPPWLLLSDEAKESLVNGVRYALSGATPEESHENWCRFKREHGWTLGPVKDEDKKEHPLLVPYEQLPEAQRIKDDLFTGIVRALDLTRD